jgi:hypothetical protein
VVDGAARYRRTSLTAARSLRLKASATASERRGDDELTPVH